MSGGVGGGNAARADEHPGERFLGAVLLHEMVKRGASRQELIAEAMRQRRFDVVRYLQETTE